MEGARRQTLLWMQIRSTCFAMQEDDCDARDRRIAWRTAIPHPSPKQSLSFAPATRTTSSYA